MTVLPKFYKETPVIKEVNFTKNPLKMLTVQELAPLCTLQTLILDTWDVNTTFNKESAYCEYQRTIKWFHISMISGFSNFSCYKCKNMLHIHKFCFHQVIQTKCAFFMLDSINEQPPKCNLKFDRTILETRSKCIESTLC